MGYAARMALSKVLSWLADATGQQILGSILGSAFMAAVINAVVRSYTILPWEWAWILWTGTALAGFVVSVEIAKRFYRHQDERPKAVDAPVMKPEWQWLINDASMELEKCDGRVIVIGRQDQVHLQLDGPSPVADFVFYIYNSSFWPVALERIEGQVALDGAAIAPEPKATKGQGSRFASGSGGHKIRISQILLPAAIDHINQRAKNPGSVGFSLNAVTLQFRVNPDGQNGQPVGKYCGLTLQGQDFKVAFAEPAKQQPGDKIFAPSAAQVSPMSSEELVKSVYGRHVHVGVASLFATDDSKYVEFSFFAFNGSNERVSTKVSGKLLYDTWATVPWVTAEPSNVGPKTEFLVGLRMVLAPEMAEKITRAIEAGARVEFGLDRLEILLTTVGGAQGQLDIPVAVQCFKGIQTGRTLATRLEARITPKRDLDRP